MVFARKTLTMPVGTVATTRVAPRSVKIARDGYDVPSARLVPANRRGRRSRLSRVVPRAGRRGEQTTTTTTPTSPARRLAPFVSTPRRLSGEPPTFAEQLSTLLDENRVGERGSAALLVVVAVLYGSAVPVVFDPLAAAAWRDTPGLHTVVRSLVAALLLLPVVFLRDAADDPRGRVPDADPRRVARWGVEFGCLVWGATYCQWRHDAPVAPESFFLALALGPVLSIGTRTLGPGGVPLLSAATARGDGRTRRATRPGTFGKPRAAAAAAAAARENRALLAGLITQEGVALVGILVLAVDPDSALEFEPWGIAAAVLFTWGIVRSEVLTARESLTAKARVAAIQTGTAAALAAIWAATELSSLTAEGGSAAAEATARALPLGELTYLGVLTAVVSVLEPVAVNKHTRGYAMLAFGLIPVTGAAWQWLAGGTGASLANGVGRLSWGEAIGFAVTAPPFLLFWLQRLAGEDAEDARKSSGTATRRRVGFERVFDRLLGREDEPRATAEGVRASVVGNLLKNPWWAVKAGTKGQAAGTAAKAATGNLGKVAAGQAGKSAVTGAAGKAAALSGAVAQIPTLGVEGEAASGVVDAVASLIGDGGASATSAAGAGKAAGGGTAAAGKAASAAAAAGGESGGDGRGAQSGRGGCGGERGRVRGVFHPAGLRPRELRRDSSRRGSHGGRRRERRGGGGGRRRRSRVRRRRGRNLEPRRRRTERHRVRSVGRRRGLGLLLQRRRRRGAIGRTMRSDGANDEERWGERFANTPGVLDAILFSRAMNTFRFTTGCSPSARRLRRIPRRIRPRRRRPSRWRRRTPRACLASRPRRR